MVFFNSWLVRTLGGLVVLNFGSALVTVGGEVWVVVEVLGLVAVVLVDVWLLFWNSWAYLTDIFCSNSGTYLLLVVVGLDSDIVVIVVVVIVFIAVVMVVAVSYTHLTLPTKA